jgi:hypothetical protein
MEKSGMTIFQILSIYYRPEESTCYSIIRRDKKGDRKSNRELGKLGRWEFNDINHGSTRALARTYEIIRLQKKKY